MCVCCLASCVYRYYVCVCCRASCVCVCMRVCRTYFGTMVPYGTRVLYMCTMVWHMPYCNSPLLPVDGHIPIMVHVAILQYCRTMVPLVWYSSTILVLQYHAMVHVYHGTIDAIPMVPLVPWYVHVYHWYHW